MTNCGVPAESFPSRGAGRTTTRIINEVPGINRVVCDLSTKPPGTIERGAGLSRNASTKQTIM